MKFGCTCGHTIRDNGQLDRVKGHIIRAQSFDAAYERPAELVAEFIQAVVARKRTEWIEAFYGVPYFEVSDSSVVFDIMDRAQQGVALAVYQCEACGRLYVERDPRPNPAALRAFKPEDSDWQGALADERTA